MLGVRVPPALPRWRAGQTCSGRRLPPRQELAVSSSRNRYVIVGIVMLAVLAGISISHGLRWTFGQLGWDDMPVGTHELTITMIIAYGLALGAAVFAMRHGRTFQLASEVVD